MYASSLKKICVYDVCICVQANMYHGACVEVTQACMLALTFYFEAAFLAVHSVRLAGLQASRDSLLSSSCLNREVLGL